jgi:F-type H+-transporting ATPase subunit b
MRRSTGRRTAVLYTTSVMAPVIAPVYTATITALFWLVSGPARALQPGHSGEVESGAHTGEHAIHHDGITLFNWPSAEDPRIGIGYLLINFVVLAFLIHRLILRKLVDDNAVRHAEIKRQVEDAAAALAAAKAQLADYKTRMDRVDQESQQILDQARRAAEADRTRLVAEAEQEVERFKTTAMAAAQREVGQRRAELEAEVIDRAIARASELISARFTDADHGRLVDDYAVELANNSTVRA